MGYGDLSPTTTIGKLVVMLFMVGGLGLFAVGIGVIAFSFAELSRLYENSDADPMGEFRKEWKKREVILQAEEEYTIEEVGTEEWRTDALEARRSFRTTESTTHTARRPQLN